MNSVYKDQKRVDWFKKNRWWRMKYITAIFSKLTLGLPLQKKSTGNFPSDWKIPSGSSLKWAPLHFSVYDLITLSKFFVDYLFSILHWIILSRQNNVRIESKGAFLDPNVCQVPMLLEVSRPKHSHFCLQYNMISCQFSPTTCSSLLILRNVSYPLFNPCFLP